MKNWATMNFSERQDAIKEEGLLEAAREKAEIKINNKRDARIKEILEESKQNGTLFNPQIIINNVREEAKAEVNSLWKE